MKRLLSVVAGALLVVCGILVLMPAPAQASAVIVTNCTSLGVHAAIDSANPGDELVFACTPISKTIAITTTLGITKPLTINGGGYITLSGASMIQRIIRVTSGGLLTLTNIRMTDGTDDQGGALGVFAATALVSNATFIRNRADDPSSLTSGGAIYNSGGSVRVVNSRFLTNTVDTQGNDSGDGGAIGSNGILTVENSIFSGNVSDDGGGAITQFSIGRLDLRNSTFISNSASSGGAVKVMVTSTVTGNVFSRNRAEIGGAIDTDFFVPILIANSTVFSNTATTGGGALRNRSILTLDSMTFAGNRSEGGDGGGAILNRRSLTLNDNKFFTNSAAFSGGAIVNRGELTLNDSRLVSNTALLSGGAISNTGLLIVSTSVFTGNAATAPGGLGGAIVNALTATLDVNDSTFVFNRGAAGGAIDIQPNTTAQIRRSALISNTASSGGGGGILNNGLLSVTNSTFARNHSAFNGAAIFNGNAGANTWILNSTIVSHTPSVGAALRNAIVLPAGAMTLTNSIVANNTPANCAGVIGVGPRNMQFGDATCGGGFISANPLLGPLAHNGGPTPTYALQSGSPAIDNGDNAACPPTDQRGVVRPQLGVCDIGAYEALPPYQVYLPSILR